ncbi:P450-derived glycosyltransferase activator [Micromonospora rifamycinica]|uniref:cytochrome P450 family protein n=1 Tax=Micromonospora rifamycinica TaxID=291594 RepID=UPI002E294C93|nr:P450-derived glycosyltransferase activator [Micromonospora rifamycinica]
MLTQTESELGRSLMTERGMQWLYAHGGDPLATLLRAEDEDRGVLRRRIHEAGPLRRSRNGAWLTGDLLLGGEILHDPRITPGTPADVPHGNDLRRRITVFGLPGQVWRRWRDLAGPDPDHDAVEQVCVQRLERIGDAFDLVTDLLRPVLVAVVADLHRVPAADRAAFDRCCLAAAPVLDARLAPPRLTRARELIDGIDGLAALHRRLVDGDDDLVTAATASCPVRVDVAVNTAANAVRALFDHPTAWQALADDPGLAERVVEETLRHDPPIRLESRIARTDLETAGQRISAGSEIVVNVEAANRDPRHGADLARFDPFRTPAPTHLSLTGAPYLELVAPLVRVSAAATLRVLATRRPRLRPGGPVVRRLRAPVTDAITRMPVHTP